MLKKETTETKGMDPGTRETCKVVLGNAPVEDEW
jgi:hypothetical protein